MNFKIILCCITLSLGLTACNGENKNTKNRADNKSILATLKKGNTNGSTSPSSTIDTVISEEKEDKPAPAPAPAPALAPVEKEVKKEVLKEEFELTINSNSISSAEPINTNHIQALEQEIIRLRQRIIQLQEQNNNNNSIINEKDLQIKELIAQIEQLKAERSRLQIPINSIDNANQSHASTHEDGGPEHDGSIAYTFDFREIEPDFGILTMEYRGYKDINVNAGITKVVIDQYNQQIDSLATKITNLMKGAGENNNSIQALSDLISDYNLMYENIVEWNKNRNPNRKLNIINTNGKNDIENESIKWSNLKKALPDNNDLFELQVLDKEGNINADAINRFPAFSLFTPGAAHYLSKDYAIHAKIVGDKNNNKHAIIKANTDSNINYQKAVEYIKNYFIPRATTADLMAFLKLTQDQNRTVNQSLNQYELCNTEIHLISYIKEAIYDRHLNKIGFSLDTPAEQVEESDFYERGFKKLTKETMRDFICKSFTGISSMYSLINNPDVMFQHPEIIKATPDKKYSPPEQNGADSSAKEKIKRYKERIESLQKS